jgi:nitroreductase
MDFIKALETRRSVRSYQERGVDRSLVEKLITLATQAPSAMNSQPWAFVVITDKEMLEQYSTYSKELLLATMEQFPLLEKYRGVLSQKSFNIFYKAPALVVIYAKPESPQPQDNCCLAAQNFMLSAHDAGLGTCWIGFAREFLNSPEAKAELGIPAEYTAIAPMILGWPAAESPAVPRKAPEIYWK